MELKLNNDVFCTLHLPIAYDKEYPQRVVRKMREPKCDLTMNIANTK